MVARTHMHACILVWLAKTIYIRCIYGILWYFWQGNHQTYGHIRCIYTVLANPTYLLQAFLAQYSLCLLRDAGPTL
jgi:hypothetical protein